MPQTNQHSLTAVQPELTSGESILWAGQPNTHVIFHREDLFLVPFSLLWGGFAIFWEAGVSGLWGSGQHPNGPWFFGMLWGIPFVLIRQYFIWGRFFYAARKKKRTHYALTDRRVIVVQNGRKRQMASTYIDTLPSLIKEGGSKGVGTLRFAQAEPIWSGRRGWGAWGGMSVGSAPTSWMSRTWTRCIDWFPSCGKKHGRRREASERVVPVETLATRGTGSPP
jgi:hypothetical protein